jgi:hypothetical protein
MRLQPLPPSLGICTLTALACLATAVACGGGAAPKLTGLSDQVAQVGVELKVDLVGEDADGDSLSYNFKAGGISNLGQAGITVSPSGNGVFRWTPLANHVGDHAFDFTVSDGSHDTTVTINIKVRSAIGAVAAPVFRSPLGTGTTLDLSKKQCVDLDIIVEDQDTTNVVIAQEEPIIDGAELVEESGQSATWSWCPTREQEAESRYMLTLSADDLENPKVEKTFLVVLRSGDGSNCPGGKPAIAHTPMNVTSILDVPITAMVTDDKGIKSDLLLYYSTTEPTNPPEGMTQVSMPRIGGSPMAGDYKGLMENPVAQMPQGAKATLYYMIAATDDDDEMGSCDHTTTSKVYKMEVTSSGSGNSEICAPCSHDTQCGAGDLCVYVPANNGSYCLQACGVACPGGFSCSSQPVRSVDGAEAKQCVPQNGSCDAPDAPCADDIWEENDTRSNASANPALVEDTTYDELTSCPSTVTQAADDDWFKLTPAAEGDLTLHLSGGSTTDLDLRLYRSDGTVLSSSTSMISDEQIKMCLPALTYYVKVNAVGHARNDYTLTYETTAKTCVTGCVDDPREQDDTYSQARATTKPTYESTGNVICPGDDDFYRVPLVTGESIKVDLTFMQSSPSEDLDIHIYQGPNDLTPCEWDDPYSSCSSEEGQGGVSNESTIFTAPPGCEAGCDFSVVVHGYRGSTNSYAIKIAVQ